MSSVNLITLIGNLGNDPDFKILQSGTQVCNFNIATNEREKVGDEWVDKTLWFKIAVWGKKAEACAKFLKKGSMVFVQGPIAVEQWTDRENNPQVSLKVSTFNCEFLSGWKSNEEANTASSGGGDSDLPPELQTALNKM